MKEDNYNSNDKINVKDSSSNIDLNQLSNEEKLEYLSKLIQTVDNEFKSSNEKTKIK